MYLQGGGRSSVRGASPTASPLPRHLLQRVLERMHDLVADLDLQTLAAESGCSRSHFLRMFEAATGRTPHRYVQQLRLERAQELIRKGSTPLIDIAALCGFASHAHMSRVFRQLLGVTPSQYRRNL
jgi:AraC family transcriptional regulator